MYPEELCTPMREELTNAGFIELKTEDEVDNFFQKKDVTFLIFINSVSQKKVTVFLSPLKIINL